MQKVSLVEQHGSLIKGIQAFEVVKQGRAHQGESNRKYFGFSLCFDLLGNVVHLGYFFRSEVGSDAFEGFLVISAFTGPGKLVTDFDIAYLVDENVSGSDVSELGTVSGKIPLGSNQVVKQKPKFGLLEFRFLTVAMINFFTQKIGVIFEVECQGSAGATESFGGEGLFSGQKEVIVRNFGILE